MEAARARWKNESTTDEVGGQTFRLRAKKGITNIYSPQIIFTLLRALATPVKIGKLTLRLLKRLRAIWISLSNISSILWAQSLTAFSMWSAHWHISIDSPRLYSQYGSSSPDSIAISHSSTIEFSTLELIVDCEMQAAPRYILLMNHWGYPWSSSGINIEGLRSGIEAFLCKQASGCKIVPLTINPLRFLS